MMTVNITTAAGRKRLPPSPEPVWHKLQKGRYVGYRAGADTWIARMYLNGANVFKALDEARSFETGKDLAEAWFDSLTAGTKARHLVDTALDDYVAHRLIERGEKSAHEARLILDRDVLPKFKARELSSITTNELKKWRDGLLRKADPKAPGAENAKRQSKSTVNKKWSCFRAALALAFQNGTVHSDLAWRRVKPFKNVEQARDFYPTGHQVAAALKHCDDDFRPLAQAAAVTGFRLQPLTQALVGDFDPIAGTLQILKDKNHARTATLSSAAVELFKLQAKDKLPTARLFMRADGLPWEKSQQQRPFRKACVAAKLPRKFIFYSFRHFFISRALLAGMNVHALAENVGTSAKMIETNYAKFIRTDVRRMLDSMDVA